MACCGRATMSVRQTPERPSAAAGDTGRTAAPIPPGRQARFEYVGPTALTVFGPYTGRQYRFQHSGSRVVVDVVDAPSLTAVPNLRRVRARSFPA